MTSTEDTGTIGQRMLRIRKSRGKTQEVIAELAGISKSYLSLLENGKRALDSLKLITDLAQALQIAPSELTRIEVPAPGNGDVDAGIDAARLAMRDVSHKQPGGQVLPVEVLRGRVTRLQEVRRRCRFTEVTSDLPGLIRDLHTSIAAGRDLDELLPLASLLHVQVTNMWLKDAGAPHRSAMDRQRCGAGRCGKVKDLAKAKTLYSELLGGQPDMDEAYYVGFNVAAQHVGLDPHGHSQGMTGPVGYWHVDDIKTSLKALLDAGAKAQHEVKDVGGAS